MKRLLLFIIFFNVVLGSQAQDMKELQRIQDSIYQVNILKSRINGVYIPSSLEDAFKELEELSDREALYRFKSAPEEMVAQKLHFGLGRWMAVNWNFEEGSRLSHIMRELGVVYQDDMINFMLRVFHRHLNNIPLDEKPLAKSYQEKRKKEKENELLQGTIIHSEIRKN